MVYEVTSTYTGTDAPAERATFARRAAAHLTDSAIVFGTWFIALLLPVIPLAAFPSWEAVWLNIGTIIALLLPVYWFGYQWRFNATGRSPGKRLLSLAIEKEHGAYLLHQAGPPGSGAGIVRTIGQVIGVIPLGLGYWWALWDGRNEAWHDKMATTRVLKVSGDYRPPIPVPDLSRGRYTPEETPASPPKTPLPHAPFLRRAAAYLIDIGALLGAMAALFMVFSILHVAFPAGRPFVYVIMVMLLTAPLYWFGYFWWSNSNGRSVGKRLMRLAAVRRTWGPTGMTIPGSGRGFKRTWAQLIGLIPFGLSYWWAAWDRDGQAWHDKIAGTNVVKLPAPFLKPAIALPEARFKMQAPEVGMSLGRTALWLVGIYVLIAVSTRDILPWEHVWPLLLVAVLSVGLAVLASRFRFLRGDVKLSDKGVAWSPDGQSVSVIPYRDVRAIQAPIEGGIVITFMSSWSSSRKLWFQEPTEKTIAFDIEDRDGFVRALAERVEAVKGERMPVVR